MVFSLCLRVLGNVDDAEDCAQEVFVRIFQKLDTFKGDSKISTWVYRVAYNAALDAARSKARRDKKISFRAAGDMGADPEDPREDPEKRALGRERDDAVQKALLALQPDQRIVLALCDIEGRSYDEISEMTGVPIGTVKSRINRGREKLRETLRGVL
jgi:RNA polymerase sigma-70 factor (ECF subfamily)